MIEFGFFSDEGCVERQVYAESRAAAMLKLQAAIGEGYYSADDNLVVDIMCGCGNPECDDSEGHCQFDEDEDESNSEDEDDE